MSTNIPTKASGIAIQCRRSAIDPDYYEFLTSEGWMIETTYSAEGLARLVTDARDAGFEQGIESIRRALGVKK
jgi:predicted ABC-type ATPase